MNEFYKAWQYLSGHKIFEDDYKINHFLNCLDIEVIKINPKTDCIDVDTYKNTKVQIWLECGPYKDERPVHDIDLDCGGDSFEEAIINLAKLVQEKYDE